MLNDPAWGGIAITVNATSGERLDAAKAIAASIEGALNGGAAIACLGRGLGAGVG